MLSAASPKSDAWDLRRQVWLVAGGRTEIEGTYRVPLPANAFSRRRQARIA